ncbi:protein lyk5 [Quercus suber]|uniref:Protein lyk5 n=1 Tax=Quercus suber TaxID=58331 RepID=A0AAW0KL23_QUESU
MESFSFYTLSIALFLCLCYDTTHCQQAYLNNSQLNCTSDPSISKGYLCNRPLQTCKSYVTFRSQPPYDTAKSIADLLGSDASLIASINNVSNIFDSIPADKLSTVPITCLCSGTIYQYYAHYTAKKSDTYFHIANDTYQGLTTCQALTGQNYYNSGDIPVGTELTVPVRCACPTENQTENGVISLLDYMVKRNDTVLSIAKAFGVSVWSVLEANMLSQNSTIYPFTPILVPLESETCTTNPGSFFCDCPNGYAADGVSCKTDPRKFPIKWIALLERNLVSHFIAMTKEDRLHQILQPQVAREASREDIHAIANLAMRCLRLNGKKRPTMKEVSMELEALRISQKGLENFQMLREFPRASFIER